MAGDPGLWMGLLMAKRHRWGESGTYVDDGRLQWRQRCLDCPAIRYSDGIYRQPDGTITRTAGPCEPKEKEGGKSC